MPAKLSIRIGGCLQAGRVGRSEARGSPRQLLLRAVTILFIARAASNGSSCSQTRITNQPAFFRCASVSLSRSMFLASFSCHHVRLALGNVPCIGHLCQKQPSMKTATFSLGKAMSIVRRDSDGTWRCLRNRRPILCRQERIATSIELSRWGVFFIRRETPLDDGGGVLQCRRELTAIRPASCSARQGL